MCYTPCYTFRYSLFNSWNSKHLTGFLSVFKHVHAKTSCINIALAHKLKLWTSARVWDSEILLLEIRSVWMSWSKCQADLQKGGGSGQRKWREEAQDGQKKDTRGERGRLKQFEDRQKVVKTGKDGKREERVRFPCESSVFSAVTWAETLVKLSGPSFLLLYTHFWNERS